MLSEMIVPAWPEAGWLQCTTGVAAYVNVSIVSVVSASPRSGEFTTTVATPAGAAEVTQQICSAVLVWLAMSHGAPPKDAVIEASRWVPLMQTKSPPKMDPWLTSSAVRAIDSSTASSRYAPTTLTLVASGVPPLEPSVAIRTVASVPTSDSGEAVGPVMHSSEPMPLATTVQLAMSAEPPLARSVTRIREGSAWKPLPLIMRRTPPAADPAAIPLAGPLILRMLKTPRTATTPFCAAYPFGGTCTSMGEAAGASGQSGMVHVMLVASWEFTRHTRPSQTSTVGSAVPPTNPVPVSTSVALAATCADDTAVSVGVAAEAKEKLHGRSAPAVESEGGSV